jgi:hypothetical protein
MCPGLSLPSNHRTFVLKSGWGILRLVMAPH